MGAFIVLQDLPQDSGRVVGLQLQIPRLQFSVDTGDFRLGVEARKGVAAPFFLFCRGFRQVAVGGDVFQSAKHINVRISV